MRCPICDTIHEADDLCSECRDEVAYTLAGYHFQMPDMDEWRNDIAAARTVLNEEMDG